MLTIKAFAELCGCTAQTLRYYDRIGLLRPAQVDKWTGYRYYERAQALDFIKIRNLQAADFTISEIEGLLTAPEEAMQAAFAAKIAAQEEKLQRIRGIAQTYLREKNAMEKMLSGVINYMLDGCRTPAVLREFGCSEADYDWVMAALRAWLERSLVGQNVREEQVSLEVNGETTEGVREVTEKITTLSWDAEGNEVHLSDGSADDAEYEVIWEKHGWAHPHQFLQEIPPLVGDKPYEFAYRLAEFPWPKDLSYGMFMVGAMMLARGEFPCKGCNVESSDDGVNHFALLRRK